MSIVRTEKLSDADAAAKQFEGEIREFVRRDVTIRRRARMDGNLDANLPVSDQAVAHVNGLISQVSGASIEEIDRVIGELHGMRDVLAREGENVRRQLADFAALSQVAMTSMRIIADSVSQCKPVALQARGELE